MNGFKMTEREGTSIAEQLKPSEVDNTYVVALSLIDRWKKYELQIEEAEASMWKL